MLYPFINDGPSTATDPYVIHAQPNIRFVSLLTSGDQVGTKANGTPWIFAGIPDGIGAYDNGDGTATVLVNHEFGATSGVVRDHGATGAFISRLVINKTDLSIVSASDAIKSEYLWDVTANSGNGAYVLSTSALTRFCSGDLAPVSAFYNPTSGKGTQARIYLTGEEAGTEGRPFALVATGTDSGKLFELPKLGNLSFENLLANPNTGDKTVVVATDDSTPGQVYVYIGSKQSSGTEIEKAGLTNGALYGIKASFAAEASTGTALSGQFSLVALADQTKATGANLQTESGTLGVTEWLRPEDGAWDTVNANRFYFVTTNSFSAPSRLWALDFTDINDPSKGGTFTALLDGTEGQKMLDNFTVSTDGTLILQEDVGNNPRSGVFWSYDPKTDKLTKIATHDPELFGDGTAAKAPFTQDEESSGIIDVTSIFGDATTKAYLYDTQAHYAFQGKNATEVVEGGQLGLMLVEQPVAGSLIFDISGSTADQIYSLYEAAFNRVPDEAGFRYWHSVATTGKATLAQIAEMFANSGEFAQKNGANLSSQQLVQNVYQNAFDHGADTLAATYWANRLDNAEITKGEFLVGITGYPELTLAIGQHMDAGYLVI